MRLTLPWHVGARSTTVLIEEGAVQSHALEAFLKKTSHVAIITDTTVAALYGNTLCTKLQNRGYQADIFSFSPGEASKTRKTKESIEDLLLSKHWQRDTCVVALGGGVVTDLGGFVAATYNRGLPLILIPTTLLAMVDASIGGKTAVNTQHGKNLIGAYYPAEAVIIDPSVLQTLSEKDRKCGLVEMIKHGLISDPNYLNFLESEDYDLIQAIARSIAIKDRIVREDPQESGKRRLLNFGHTVGHALEMATDHELSHGEAVALGIWTESLIASKRGLLSQEELKKIVQFFKRFNVPLKAPVLSSESIWQYMQSDKKGSKGLPKAVMIKQIGVPISFEGNFCDAITQDEFKLAWREVVQCSQA